MKTLLLIDSHALIHRFFHALPLDALWIYFEHGDGGSKRIIKKS